MHHLRKTVVAGVATTAALILSHVHLLGASTFTFSCEAENDLYTALKAGERAYPRFASAHEAIQHAGSNTTVLILNDQWPAHEASVEPSDLTAASEKHLRVFVECPPAACFPDLKWGPKQTAVWERGVVTSDDFGTALPKMKILALNLCEFQTVAAPAPLLCIARVAGYDTAIYGLPTSAQPILFEVPAKNSFIATTTLSGFINRRYAPVKDWQTFWEKFLGRLDTEGKTHHLKFEPAVATQFSATEKLPRHFEKKTFDAAAKWLVNSHLLVHPSWRETFEKKLAAEVETTLPPEASEPIGDGSAGIMEGYASGIRPDGNQFRRTPLRADCCSDSAMVLALDSSLNRNAANATIASNLLDYVYFKSGMCGGVRADPKHGAYGLVGWGSVSPSWLVANYGDDNASVILGTMAVAACLKNNQWDEALMKAILANFRTTGKLGFRGDRVDVPALQQYGWKHFYDAETVSYSPHFESMLWACNMWAYRQTGFRPFLERTRTAMAMTMKVYPGEWRWKDNLERAHILLSLAWLVRVDDTPEHRQWLKTVATDLLASQQPSGTIHDRMNGTGGGHLHIPQSNEAYGTGETPLIQKDGDPTCDQLYTTGYALLSLHEAYGATGDLTYKKAEDRLAEFLCRIQIRSKKFPYLNGFWFRAFDDRDWEFWASSADAGWGAWSVEAGWGQSWTAATLALREKKTTLWDLTAGSGVGKHFEKLKAEMLEGK